MVSPLATVSNGARMGIARAASCTRTNYSYASRSRARACSPEATCDRPIHRFSLVKHYPFCELPLDQEELLSELGGLAPWWTHSGIECDTWSQLGTTKRNKTSASGRAVSICHNVAYGRSVRACLCSQTATWGSQSLSTRPTLTCSTSWRCTSCCGAYALTHYSHLKTQALTRAWGGPM